MRTLALATALLLFAGCNDASKTESAPVQKAAETPAAAAPVPAAETPAPAAPQPQSAPAAELSPAVLFQKCAACHGNQAEKSALNQSAIIGSWDHKRIAAAITGYQQGTYGGAMKTLMLNQVKELSAEQVTLLSDYIANLNVKTH